MLYPAPDALEVFLSQYGDKMEFCQIQLNYLDWTLQDAKRKCEILRQAEIPVWVMEPVRGGRLASFDAETEANLRALRPEESIPAWAFRWLQTVPKPTMVLSGMSNLQQMEDNIKTFSEEKPLNEQELELIREVSNGIARLIPCTGCRYCCAGCPKGIDIPKLLSMANDLTVYRSFNVVMRYSAIEENKRADACIGCGQCSRACPQKINVPEELAKLADVIKEQKSWEEICRERAEAAAKQKENK